MLTKAQKMDLVALHFCGCPTKDVAFMCGCTPEYVQHLAYSMGLRKSAAARARSFYVGRERYWK